MRFAAVTQITNRYFAKLLILFRADRSTSDQQVVALPHESCFLRPRGGDTWPFRVNALAFSGDGRFVAIGSSDNKTARVFEIRTGKEISRLTEDGGVIAVAFSLDGRFILTADMLDDRTSQGLNAIIVTKEPLWMNDLIKEACSRLTRNLTENEWESYIRTTQGRAPQRTCQNLPVPR